MFFGYNTNGFAHHDLEDAIVILAELGYRGVALTLDHGALNPYQDGVSTQCARVDALLKKHDLHTVIETGARFLLDPRRKHAPTLLDPDPDQRKRRLRFLEMAVHLARSLRAEAVSLWSGARPDGCSEDQAFSLLVTSCRQLLWHAEMCEVPLAFEPEPGMFIDTMARFTELHERINHPLFGLTLDVGHVHCLQDGRVTDHIEAWSGKLFNVHLEDMKAGVHDHLPFGLGEIDFPPIFAALKKIDYPHGAYVELSRHSHDAVQTAQAAHSFLARWAGSGL